MNKESQASQTYLQKLEDPGLLQPCMLQLYSYDFSANLKQTPFKKEKIVQRAASLNKANLTTLSDDSVFSESSVTPRKGILKKNSRYSKRRSFY